MGRFETMFGTNVKFSSLWAFYNIRVLEYKQLTLDHCFPRGQEYSTLRYALRSLRPARARAHRTSLRSDRAALLFNEGFSVITLPDVVHDT
jgi:hypothetical protein